jgi:hypothetical protein
MPDSQAPETPQLAAVSGPADRLRAVAADVDAEHRRATVLVATRSGELLVRYCIRADDGWVLSDRDPASTADLAWSSQFASSDPEPVLTFATRAPEGVRQAVVRFAGEDRLIDASNGYVIASWWGVDADAADQEPPIIVGYH